jgi:peptide/nickel transport system permease protein
MCSGIRADNQPARHRRFLSIGGTVVVETVFNVPGMGQLMIRAVLTRDYFVVQGVTLFFALGVVITTFVVDVVTVALDPRVKL